MRQARIMLAATALWLPSTAGAQDVVMRRPIPAVAMGGPGAPATPTPAPTQTAPTTPTPSTPAPSTPTPAPSTPTPAPHAYSWHEGDWTWEAGAATCSTAAERTRTVACLDETGAAAEDGKCSGARPAGQGTADRSEGCSYQWTVGAWSDEGVCAASSSGTRTVACRRSDQTDGADHCDGAAPPATRSGERLEGCSFDWAGSEWSAWSPACSDRATRSRTVQCQAMGGAAAFVTDDAHCAGDRPGTAEGPSAYYGNCAGRWDFGAWTRQGLCTDAVRTETRTPVCAVTGGTDPTEAACDPTAKPAPETRTATCIGADETRLGAIVSGASVSSPSGRYRMTMRADGVLAIEDATTGATVWHVADSTLQKLGSDIPGAFFNAQSDGNMVVYAAAADGGSPRWNSFTWNATGGYGVITDQGAFKVYHPDGRVIYQSTGDSGADYHWNAPEGRYVP